MDQPNNSAEETRRQEHYRGDKNWLKWGPYLSERQWGTVREDYSPSGEAWEFFPHDHARSRVYRWGEDGLAGISDHLQRMCFAVALWNGRDPILKERLFGLTGNEGNHGEDVKELYYYLDNTPTHSYMKHLYKYPQAAYPYHDLVSINGARSRQDDEYEILDTGVFDDSRYFDVFTEYAKVDEEDLLIKITVHNRGPEDAPISVLPTLWFRNRWSFGLMEHRPSIRKGHAGEDYGIVEADHEKLGRYQLYFQNPDHLLFTENETNTEKLFGYSNHVPFVKDAFHEAVVRNDYEWLENNTEGSKCAPVYQRMVKAGASVEIRLRLC